MKKIRNGNPIQYLLLGMGVLLLFVFVACPLFLLFMKAFQTVDGTFAGAANFREYFSSPHLSQSLWNTMGISLVTTTVTLIMALLYAYGLSRANLPGRAFFRFAAMLPLFAPTMMLGIGLITLFGNKGLLTAAGLGIPLYGPVGIVLSEIVYTFPQAVLIFYISLSYADNRLYEAARIMGAGPLKIFFTVTLPGIRYGLVSATFVVFTLCFTDFGAPKVVGGNFNVLATDIYKQVVGQQNFGMGAVVGILLMVPALLSFAADRLVSSGAQGTIGSGSVAYRIRPDGIRDAFFTFYCLTVVLAIFLLLGAVLLTAVIKAWPYNMSLTLEHFRVDSPGTGGTDSFFNSLFLAGTSAAAGTIFVFLNAWLVEKTRGFALLRRTIALLSLIPLALPGLAIGIAFIFFFSMPGNPLRCLYGTFWILVAANVVHFYSVPFVTASGALKKLDREIESVSDSLNVPPHRTLFRVTLPLCREALLEILLYFFVNSMVTISAVVFLYPADFKPAAVAIVNMEDAGDIAPAAALSVLVLGANIAARLFYELLSHRIKRHRERLSR